MVQAPVWEGGCLMKKIMETYEADVIRLTLDRGFTKFITALAAVLLWDRFLGLGGITRLRDGGLAAAVVLLAAAVVLLAAAWIGYLRLDGVQPSRLPEPAVETFGHPAHGGITGLADEHTVPMAQAEREDRRLCGVLSSLLAAVTFLVSSMLLSLFAK